MIYSFRHPKREKKVDYQLHTPMSPAALTEEDHLRRHEAQMKLEELGRRKRQVKYDLEARREPVKSPITLETGKITAPLCGSRPHISAVIAKSIRLARSKS